MAPSAVNGDEPATIGAEEISKPPPGVVLPPKDIRAILEKTAGYVARNGPIFEDRIREKEKNNPKFSFLSPDDPYSAFYAWRLSEIRAGRGTAIAAGRAGEGASAAAAVAAAAEAEKAKGPAEPPEFHFSARMPNISAQDLDVVRLTALFVAKNGRPFMTTLSQRETRNFQFDFLRPNHSLYQFFTRLVDQYTLLLRSGAVDGEGAQAEQERIRELQANAQDRFHVLGRAKQRAEWARFQELQKAKKEEEEEKEKLTYAQIDWHDFVVVETVLFNEADDQAELPVPTSLSDLQSASLEQKAMMSLAPNHMRIEESMPSEEDHYYNPYAPSMQPAAIPLPPPSYGTPSMPPPPPPMPVHAALPNSPYAALPPPPISAITTSTSHPPPAMDIGPPSSTTVAGAAAGDDDDDDEDEAAQRIRERAATRARAKQAQADAKGGAPGPMKIRSDYVPRAAQQAAQRRGVQLALCPNCKQQIPYEELDEHMRIELLDPRWKEQREKAESRYGSTNLSTADVANNLKRLASQRTDVFDAATLTTSASNGAMPPSTGGGDDDHRASKRIAYDGMPETKDAVQRLMLQQQQIKQQQMQHANVSEQIRGIHERYGKKDDQS
ncbi:MAG: SF3a splicing factor complex subunit [Phylliscum demangeonii]|nr:MAG: SF3a splicing factor complex subunit [Phylliscum demangeonii]